MKQYIFALALILPILIGAQVPLRRNYGADIPPGTVITFAGTVCPAGFLSTDGDPVSRTQYPQLFAAISTLHGNGNGTTTFHKPDYRGRFLRMVDGAAGLDPDKAARVAMNAGGAVGNNVGSVQLEQFKSHSHTITGYTRSGNIGTAVIVENPNLGVAPSTATLGQADPSSGGNESRPDNAYVMYCIKY